MSLAITKAKELAGILAKSSEYRNFQQAKIQVEKNPTCRKQLTDFRAKQAGFQREFAAGKKDERKINELENIHRNLMNNAILKHYLTSEYQFSKLMLEVHKILGDAVGLNDRQ